MPAHDRILIVTAVRAETRAVLGAVSRIVRVRDAASLRRWDGRAGERPITIVEAGIGPVRAAAALGATLAPTDLVISAGFAGSLVADGAPGDVLLPPTIVWDRASDLERYAVSATLHDILERSLADGRLRRGPAGAIFSSPTVVASPAAKLAAGARTGTVAVEMEAAGLIEVARERDVPVLAVRVLLDGADVSLEHVPPDLDSSWKARARLVTRPAAWPGVLTLARHVPTAARALGRAMALVLPSLSR